MKREEREGHRHTDTDTHNTHTPKETSHSSLRPHSVDVSTLSSSSSSSSVSHRGLLLCDISLRTAPVASCDCIVLCMDKDTQTKESYRCQPASQEVWHRGRVLFVAGGGWVTLFLKM
ncbi:hypothetical protein ILYODFUR_010771 [Ilyodon furcidens]|uniref:Uncharacterized protein n=1 Tax=Ilyodon furcidens TaxID=33524 RepID=A0ABV0V220_9TELE